MRSEASSMPNRKHSQPPKPDMFSDFGMLNPSEIEQLKQDKKDANAWFQKELRKQGILKA